MFSIMMSIEAMKLSFKKKIIIGINIIGVICLGYYALPYLMHDTTIGNSEAMLPMREYEASGFCFDTWIFAAGNCKSFGIFVNKMPK